MDKRKKKYRSLIKIKFHKIQFWISIQYWYMYKLQAETGNTRDGKQSFLIEMFN